MSKELTEKWKDGELPNGNYYTICLQGWSNSAYEFPCIVYCERNCFSANVVEVLAPVPTYAEFMDLMSNLEYIDKYRDLYASNKQLMTHIKTCEQQIECLQEQLKEANELLKKAAYGSKENAFPLPYVSPEECRKYLEKWGVK